MLGDQVLQVGGGGIGPAGGQEGVAAALAGPHVQLGQPQPVGRGARQVAQLGQRLAAPELQRPVEQRHAAGRVAAGHRAVALLGQLGEAEAVQLGRAGLQQVARRPGEQHGRRLARAAAGLEDPPQVGDVGLQGAGDGRRRLLAPQRRDDPVDGHHPPGLGQQEGQQRPRLGPADVHRPAVGVLHLERAEDAETHGPGSWQLAAPGGGGPAPVTAKPAASALQAGAARVVGVRPPSRSPREEPLS